MKKNRFLLFAMALIALSSCSITQKTGYNPIRSDQLLAAQQLILQHNNKNPERKQDLALIERPFTESNSIQLNIVQKHCTDRHITLSGDCFSKRKNYEKNPLQMHGNKIQHAIFRTDHKQITNKLQQTMHDWLRIWLVALIFAVLFLLFALLPGIGPLFSILAYIALAIFVIAFVFWILQYLGILSV